MAIFLTETSRVIVQGMTGSEGTKHTRRMLASGTNIVGGVNARKAGTSVDFDGDSKPVFGSVAEAIDKTGADTSVLFVPPAFTRDAIIEAIDARIGLAVVITEGVPVHDTAYAWAYAVKANQGRAEQTRIIGPNCPGIISPGKSNAGIIPADITGPGRVGLVSKSGTLTYQMMYELRDLGFSTAVRIGRHRAGQEGGPRGRWGQGRQDPVGNRTAAARGDRLIGLRPPDVGTVDGGESIVRFIHQ